MKQKNKLQCVSKVTLALIIANAFLQVINDLIKSILPEYNPQHIKISNELETRIFNFFASDILPGSTEDYYAFH